jgi:hypothetical protein
MKDMVLIGLDNNEISVIKKALESVFIRGISNKEYFVYLLLKWFKIKGISYDSSQKIVSSLTKPLAEYGNKKTELRDIYNSQYDMSFGDSNTIEQEMKKLLVEIDGEDTASRILSAIKSLLPQKKFSNNLIISPHLNNSMYGILSYDGPIIALCDYENKQIVKGYFVRREDFGGREYRSLRIGEVLVEACPINVVIYPNDSESKTLFEIQWESFIGNPFVTGPSSLSEIITILKHKDLVLNSSTLECALITICRAFIETGKASFKNINTESSSSNQVSLEQWMIKE